MLLWWGLWGKLEKKLEKRVKGIERVLRGNSLFFVSSRETGLIIYLGE
jgi:hypothetical protein